MRVNALSILLAVIILLQVANAEDAAPVVAAKIIANAEISVERLKVADLAAIYLGRKSSWASGDLIVPALPAEGDSLTQAFLHEALRKSTSQYRAYWKRRLFSGGGVLPRTMRSSADMLDYVARTPGAIGIVAESVELGESAVRVISITD
ncbi:MAG: hypothetical protein HOM68_00145 [Gemmatimonadetes bacterium]|jgi:ABC-type phosphate transport system substrate-binding protein|nr:hypothetical protein [Gemmatimonadota bacterium]MBT5054920.1 hypothetical protein [Gemmatimonadota bacterium]MBT5145841.1 hypothetical protein [Gemmatimonadota bacterium]MBT5587822.1 hypothetical protein [Gemmatimonadota bacterium]MBT5962366.1 hypothetical protein [Gemmatimonadota bacterium]